jgi:hypothetical protein
MPASANVVHFFAHELTGLCRWRFAGAFVSPRALQCRLFGHESSSQIKRVTQP